MTYREVQEGKFSVFLNFSRKLHLVVLCKEEVRKNCVPRTILFIGMQLSRLFPWWVHNLRYDTAFLPFLTRTLTMIFIVQHLTKLQIFTKIGMHSKNSTKASSTTYNSRSVAMKPNPYLQYSLVQNKALKSCWSSNLTHRPPHLLMLSNLLILIANIYSFIFHVYFRVRCAFPMFFPNVRKSVSIPPFSTELLEPSWGMAIFKKSWIAPKFHSWVIPDCALTFHLVNRFYRTMAEKTWQLVIFLRPQEHYITNFRRL